MGQPTKQEVRDWLTKRTQEHTPPPDQEQVRRELGWDLVKAERENKPKEQP